MPSIPLLLVSTLCQPCSVISSWSSSHPDWMHLNCRRIWRLVLIISVGLAHRFIVLLLTWLLRGPWRKIRWFLQIKTDFINVLVVRPTFDRVSFPTNFKMVLILCHSHAQQVISSICSLEVILLLLLICNCRGTKCGFSKLGLAQFFRHYLVLSNLFFIVSVEQLVTVDRTMFMLNRFFQLLSFHLVDHNWILDLHISSPLLIYYGEAGIIVADRRSLV